MNSQLYEWIQELGGPKVIQRILPLFYKKMSEDVLIGFFFEGKDLGAIAAKQAEFILRAAGWTKEYSGQTPDRAHTSLAPILSGHFDRRLRILEETLKEQGLNPDQISVWVQFEESFRRMVVAKPSKK